MDKETARLILYFLPIVIFAIWNFRLRWLIKDLGEIVERYNGYQERDSQDIRDRQWEHYHKGKKSWEEHAENEHTFRHALYSYLGVEPDWPECPKLVIKKRTK